MGIPSLKSAIFTVLVCIFIFRLEKPQDIMQIYHLRKNQSFHQFLR